MLDRSGEWNRIRAVHITGSSCAAVLNRSPFETRTELLERRAFEKIYGKVEMPSNVAMNEGIEWEHRIIEMSKPFVLGFDESLYYERCIGAVIKDEQTQYMRHPEIQFLGAIPDMLIMRNNEIISGLEVKKQFRFSNGTVDSWLPVKDLVYHYWCQCQLSMEVFDVDSWHFFVTDGSWTGYEKIERDREWFEESLVEFVAFMDELEDVIDDLKIQKDERVRNNG